MKCPHCNHDLTQSKWHPITYGCDNCYNVWSEAYMMGYLHGQRKMNKPVEPAEDADDFNAVCTHCNELARLCGCE